MFSYHTWQYLSTAKSHCKYRKKNNPINRHWHASSVQKALQVTRIVEIMNRKNAVTCEEHTFFILLFFLLFLWQPIDCVLRQYECECHKNYNRKDVSIKTMSNDTAKCVTRAIQKTCATTTMRIVIEKRASHWNSATKKIEIKFRLWNRVQKKAVKEKHFGITDGRNKINLYVACVLMMSGRNSCFDCLIVDSLWDSVDIGLFSILNNNKGNILEKFICAAVAVRCLMCAMIVN